MLPKYLFAELDDKKAEMINKGVDIIDLGIGDPDIMPSKKMIGALKEALETAEYHMYPSYKGAIFFRESVSNWLKKYHNVTADPETEILTLIGSKEGLSHLPQAILNTGDVSLITDPCYPVHLQSMILAGATPRKIELREENGFLPDLDAVPEKDWKDAKLIVINYPNNPTSAVATTDFFKNLVDLAHKHNFIICQDAAYIDICLDDEKQPSILTIPGAKDVAIEFYSISKMFNACGWRLGFAAGNKEIIASLGKYKTAIDSGQFTALQHAASYGLNECITDLENSIGIYRERKEILCNGLEKLGLNYFKSNSTFYVWTNIPEGTSSQEYANMLLEKYGIVATPGIGFGTMGDKYIRFSLTSPTERIKEACDRLM